MKRPEDDDYYYDDDYLAEEDDCHYCGGDGFMDGSELDDPMWYIEGTMYPCPCCNGSGLAKDCTFW
jgi:DnaJ-class molecular chaperone